MTTAAAGAVEPATTRSDGRPLSRAALVALAGIAFGIAAIGEWLYYRGLVTWASEPGLIVALDLLVGLGFAGMGLVAWHGRPDSRTGIWMYGSGLLFFVGNMGSSYVIWIQHLAITLSSLWWICLGIAILTYPTGRFRERGDLVLAIVAVVWSVGAGLVTASQFDPTGCAVCPPNPVRIVVSPGLAAIIDVVLTVGPLALWIVFAARVIRRWRRSGPAARYELRPLWLAGIAAAVSQIATGIADPFLGLPSSGYVEMFVAIPASLVVPVALAYGLVRGRLDQASVGDLVVRLGDGAAGTTLEASIAQALGDPTLRLAVPGRAGMLVALDGGPIDRPSPDRAVTTVTAGSEVIAYLIHDPALAANPGLVRSVGAAARLALENERLTAEVRAQLEAVRASRARIVEASDAERARIERNLHDGAQQRLVALDLRLRAMATAVDDPAARAEIDEAADELDEALAELRELARGIHPTAVVQSGLASAVETLAERAPLPVAVDIPRRRWPIGVEVAAYFVVAEALTNAARHAQAGRVLVTVEEGDDGLAVTVRDDGRGGADATTGSGLSGLADRVAALGGTLTIASPSAHGTTIRATFPTTEP